MGANGSILKELFNAKLLKTSTSWLSFLFLFFHFHFIVKKSYLVLVFLLIYQKETLTHPYLYSFQTVAQWCVWIAVTFKAVLDFISIPTINQAVSFSYESVQWWPMESWSSLHNQRESQLIPNWSLVGFGWVQDKGRPSCFEDEP